MGFDEFYRVFEVKSTELRGLASFIHECGVNVGKESFASLAIGIDEHGDRRMREYVTAAQLRLTALASHPIPDLPRTHPILMKCDLSKIPDLPRDADGNAVNSDAENLMIAWQRTANELADSNSAALGGGMVSFDTTRCEQNLNSIIDILDSVSGAGSQVDFAETAEPAAKSSAKK